MFNRSWQLGEGRIYIPITEVAEIGKTSLVHILPETNFITLWRMIKTSIFHWRFFCGLKCVLDRNPFPVPVSLSSNRPILFVQSGYLWLSSLNKSNGWVPVPWQRHGFGFGLIHYVRCALLWLMSLSWVSATPHILSSQTHKCKWENRYNLVRHILGTRRPLRYSLVVLDTSCGCAWLRGTRVYLTSFLSS